MPIKPPLFVCSRRLLKSDLTYDRWSQTFHIFMEVYLQKFPSDAPQLLKYVSLIRYLDRAYGQTAFLYYDKHFREHRQSFPFSWGIMHSELWIKATTLHRLQSSSHTSQNSTQSSKDRLFWKYNKRVGCYKKHCNFTHACSSCGGRSHPRYRCFLYGQVALVVQTFLMQIHTIQEDKKIRQ